ncbi:MAG: glycogen/starch/alpha-glucan phosphorylase [Epulopiscium sp.]|nr:glycogen/starch/alpha-glucan phosphorylase [Candidatus Epulonipiscium sp.]
MFTQKNFKDNVQQILKMDFGKKINQALEQEKFIAVAKALMESIMETWNQTNEKYKGEKQAYYLSAEFLMGRALGNNLLNLGIYNEVKETLKELNIQLDRIEEIEEDAGLGNGGLGRLAACFLDSSATMQIPLHGYGIRYKYGIFKQKFIDGFQMEEADHWLKYGDPWSIRKEEETVIVSFKDFAVKAVPYDTPIIGYGNENINTLRLWQAEPVEEFDFQLFNDQKYDAAVEEKNRAEDISRVLYPNDSKKQGKILRLQQQYFFVSASLQDLVRRFKKNIGKDFSQFPQYHAIQLNDTHPAVAIPELMRILVKEEQIPWKEAWKIVVKTFSYTNHTILAEALETWDTAIYRKQLPEVYEMIKKIDQQFVKELKKKEYTKEKIQQMRMITNRRIKMAWLSIYGSHTTNGVARLHTEILKHKELKDWYELYPKRFQNKTNGITPRRWIALCNPQLSGLITELLGTDEWIRNLNMLKQLEGYQDNKEVLKRFLEIKKEKKVELAEYIQIHEGISVDPNSIFDIQIKRLHEYKRQLLNAFHILDLYYRLKENPNMDIVPRTFIFGAKAAPGYIRAKGIIKYINEMAKLINNDPTINGKIKIIFVQNYRVSYAEKLFPAADVSEQISTAGKEASGTGNMKFMLNGTPTLGTLDGANVEIVAEAGEENNFIFGTKVEEIEQIYEFYDPLVYYKEVEGLKRVVDSLVDGSFDDGGTGMFKELYDSLLKGTSWHRADHYFILKDFEEYRKAQNNIDQAYRDPIKWAQKSWLNIANAGIFSSDRTILEYAHNIWDVKPIKI